MFVLAYEFSSLLSLRAHWKIDAKLIYTVAKNDLTVYDAAYLFLAEKMNAQVITADDKMCQKGKSQFRLLHLKDYV